MFCFLSLGKSNNLFLTFSLFKYGCHKTFTREFTAMYGILEVITLKSKLPSMYLRVTLVGYNELIQADIFVSIDNFTT